MRGFGRGLGTITNGGLVIVGVGSVLAVGVVTSIVEWKYRVVEGGWDAVEVKVVRSSRNGVAKPLLGGVEEGSNDTFAVWVAAPNEALTPAQAPCGNDHQPYATRWLRDGSPSPLSMSPTQHRLHASQGLHAAPLRSMQRSACSQSMELSDTSPAACIRAQTQTWGSARD